MNAAKNVIQMPVKKPIFQAIQDGLTDVFNANRFAQKFTGELTYVPQRKTWMEFNEHCWKADDNRFVVQKAIELTKEFLLDSSMLMMQAHKLTSKDAQREAIEQATKLAKHAMHCQSKKSLDALLSIAATEPSLCVSNSVFDADNNLFGVKNGVVELSKMQFRDGQPDDFITKQANTEFDIKATCENWDKFLEQMQPDAEVRLWLQKFIGYAISGDCGEQIFVVFHGNGSNGKGVFINTIKQIFGDYMQTMQFDTFTDKDKSAIRNDLACLDKVRLVIANEGADGAKLDEGIVKQLTGQDEITARFLHKEFFTYKPTFAILLVTNHKPLITGTDNGIWRRNVLVPWATTIEKDQADKNLSDKLAREKAGILNWAFEGYKLWKKEGLTLPTSLVLANDTYRKDSDVLGSWIEEDCEVEEGCWESTSELYKSYETWAKRSGHRAMSQKTLGDKFRERGFEMAKKRGNRGWKGLKVKLPF